MKTVHLESIAHLTLIRKKKQDKMWIQPNFGRVFLTAILLCLFSKWTQVNGNKIDDFSGPSTNPCPRGHILVGRRCQPVMEPRNRF